MAEGAPRHGGQELARRLAQAGLHTTLIPDSAIFAMMARVNKVLLCHPHLSCSSPAGILTTNLSLDTSTHGRRFQ